MGTLNAPTIRYCSDCNKWYRVPSTDALFICPACKKLQKKAKCGRCDYEWELLRNRYPANCPNCKSQYYNKMRVQTRSTLAKTVE